MENKITISTTTRKTFSPLGHPILCWWQPGKTGCVLILCYWVHHFHCFLHSLPFTELPSFWICHAELSVRLELTSNWWWKGIFCPLPIENIMNSWGLDYQICSVTFSQELNARHMQNVSWKQQQQKKTGEAKLLGSPPALISRRCHLESWMNHLSLLNGKIMVLC